MREDQVQQLLVQRLAVVLGVDATAIHADSRFDEDLHADSLDIVEVIEAVEQALAVDGVAVHIPDEDLAGFTTVGDAAAAIATYAADG